MGNVTEQILYAPGWPGIPARWTSSAKSGVGTALHPSSRVWFTLSHGIFDEIYYPRVDQACIRDMGLIVTDGGSFFSEEKRHTEHRSTCPVPGVPHYRLVNTCARGRYRIEKEVVAARDFDVTRSLNPSVQTFDAGLEGLNEIFTFWFAYIMTRPLGASFADWFGKPQSFSGLGLGTGPISLVLAVVIVALVGYLSVTRADSRA